MVVLDVEELIVVVVAVAVAVEVEHGSCGRERRRDGSEAI
jgi:hypothetical protein